MLATIRLVTWWLMFCVIVQSMPKSSHFIRVASSMQGKFWNGTDSNYGYIIKKMVAS